MTIETLILTQDGWNTLQTFENANEAQLVTLFGDSDTIKEAQHFEFIKQKYPKAHIIGCSSSGNIMGNEVSRANLVATAVKFNQAKVALHSIDFQKGDNLQEVSKNLAQQFELDGLKHLFILSDGLNLNGSDLVAGLNEVLNIPITGGLAGDGARFEQTWVIADAPAVQNRIAALGFYGDSLHISSGCFGGWSEFGTHRTITKSIDNVVYEIDNEPALDLYKKYLGEYAKDLPHSGLRFPLSIKKDDKDLETIRTLLAVDEESKSITFAGNVPEGFNARLMKSNIDALIEGAGQAAYSIKKHNSLTALGLVVSCVGRKIVMGQLADEELEALTHELGDNVQLSGFYSYGEIAPFEYTIKNCELHNQTMTLTVVYED
jgi:hypothetical protein